MLVVLTVLLYLANLVRRAASAPVLLFAVVPVLTITVVVCLRCYHCRNSAALCSRVLRGRSKKPRQGSGLPVDEAVQGRSRALKPRVSPVPQPKLNFA